MKFQMLIQRLQTHFEDFPNKINGDISMIADDLQVKFSEYKRIKKAVFKRQVEKAYECLSNNDEFIRTIEMKIDQLPDEISSSDADISPYEDKNEINKIITDLYKKKSSQNVDTSKPNDEVKAINSVKKRKHQNDENAHPVAKKISRSRYQGAEFVKSNERFDNYAFDENIVEDFVESIYHIIAPERFDTIDEVSKGFLLHGPPGCGKTILVNAVAGEFGLPILTVTATEIVSGISGESEENIRQLFDKAIENAPCILFIDKIETISQKRELASKEMERRIVTQLISSFEYLQSKPEARVVVIGATNSLDLIDDGLRQEGALDQEISMRLPDLNQRRKILEVLYKGKKFNENLDFDKLATNTPGYAGRDLRLLFKQALKLAKKRAFELNSELKKCGARRKIDLILEDYKGLEPKSSINCEINQIDFDEAIKRTVPASKRSGFASVPDVTWDDIGALHNVREELTTNILAPVKYPEHCESLRPSGILLVGPPGCGKTLLAKAVANEAGLNFICVSGPELINMYVGESERGIRTVFQRARNSNPCVIFFDEIDALCPTRSHSGGDSGSGARVVNQMLTEMDGMGDRKGVYLMAATNRPEMIDPAILRPGRFDKMIYVGLPSADDKYEILRALTKDGKEPNFDSDVNLNDIALDSRCDAFTGADLSHLIQTAMQLEVREFLKNPCKKTRAVVKKEHFEGAFKMITPSVSIQERKRYEEMKAKCIKL